MAEFVKTVSTSLSLPADTSRSRPLPAGRPIRIMIGAGDTAGHIHMGVAIAEEAEARFPAAEIVLVGAAGRFPSERMRDFGYDILFLDIGPYDRGNPGKNVRLPFDFLRSLRQSLRILAQRRPHVVVGLGGYPTGPLVLAARLRHIPTLLVEPNLHPGLANRFLAAAADRICIAFKDTAGFFPRRKMVLTGTPLRQAALPSSITREEACIRFNLNPGLKTVLIVGGSLGLDSLNQALSLEVHRLIASGLQVIWQTGDQHFKPILAGIPPEYLERCRIFPFISSIGPAYAAADLVVSAAGAITMAELALWRKPAIVVPSSRATEGHQIANARKYAAAGACILVREETSASCLSETILAAVANAEDLNRVSTGLEAFAQPEAGALVLQEIEKLAGMPRFRQPQAPSR